MMLPKPSAVEIVELVGVTEMENGPLDQIRGVIAADGYGDGQAVSPTPNFSVPLVAW